MLEISTDYYKYYKYFKYYKYRLFSSTLGFPEWGQLVGGQFGQNGQKLHENDKIDIFGSKQWGGGQANFLGSGGIPPSPLPSPPPYKGKPQVLLAQLISYT